MTVQQSMQGHASTSRCGMCKMCDETYQVKTLLWYGYLGVHYKSLSGPQLLQSLSHEHADVRGVDTYEAIYSPCWI